VEKLVTKLEGQRVSLPPSLPASLPPFLLPSLPVSLPPFSLPPSLTLSLYTSLLSSHTVVSCGDPPFAGNLQVHYSSMNVNATAVYSCKECFKMANGTGEGVRNGTLERLCDTSGQWIGPLPVCEGRHNSTCV